VITENDVLVGGTRVYLTYVRGQLLQANNEYNKAKLLPTTFDEYKQVFNRIPPEKLAEHPPEKAEICGWTGGLDEREYASCNTDRSNPILQGCLELCRWKWEFTGLQNITTATNRAQ